MHPVLFAAPKQVIGLKDVTPISAPTELDYGDAWDAAKELFDLAAQESDIADAIRSATVASEASSAAKPPKDAEIKKAQEKLSQLLNEKIFKIDEVGEAQRTARDRVLELFDDKCISGVGDQMAVSCEDPQKAPVRGLLLLVAVNACSPGTRDLALSLVSAMALNHQFDNHPGWLSDEARAAVRALSTQARHQQIDRYEILRNINQTSQELKAAHGDVQLCAKLRHKLQHLERQEMEFTKRIVETASTIAVLLRRAKLVSPTEKDTPEMQSFSQGLATEVNVASGCMDMSWQGMLGNVMALAGKNDQASKDEASNLLDWLAGVTHFPGELNTGDVTDIAFTDTAGEQFVKAVACYFLIHTSPKPPEWLVKAVYQRDTAAYAKVALAYMQKIVAAPQAAEVAAAKAKAKAAEEAVKKMSRPKNVKAWEAAVEAMETAEEAAEKARRAAYGAERARLLTRDMIEICESDPYFLELVAKSSDQVVLLYTKLTGKSPTPS
jgi:hypothetical protein